jgi:hypothetical protein
MGCILVSTCAGRSLATAWRFWRRIFWRFRGLAGRVLETVLSAGYRITVDLGSRRHGWAALAKALNQGDPTLAAIVLAQLQFPALPDSGAGARMNKAAAMLDHGVSAAEVLKHLLPTGELAKFNPIISAPALGADNSPRRRWTPDPEQESNAVNFGMNFAAPRTAIGPVHGDNAVRCPNIGHGA